MASTSACADLASHPSGDSPSHLTVRSPSGGSKIQAAVDGDTVSFQVDDWDLTQRSGWSVLVHGTAAIVTDDESITRLAATARRPWVTVEKDSARWVRVSNRQVTGRMILPD